VVLIPQACCSDEATWPGSGCSASDHSRGDHNRCLVSCPGARGAGQGSASSGDSGLSEKDKALLQKISALKAPRWRTFGACRYDWAGWKLMPDGVRTTSVQCGPETAATTPGSAAAASQAAASGQALIAQAAWWRLLTSSPVQATGSKADHAEAGVIPGRRPRALGSSTRQPNSIHARQGMGDKRLRDRRDCDPTPGAGALRPQP